MTLLPAKHQTLQAYCTSQNSDLTSLLYQLDMRLNKFGQTPDVISIVPAKNQT